MIRRRFYIGCTWCLVVAGAGALTCAAQEPDQAPLLSLAGPASPAEKPGLDAVASLGADLAAPGAPRFNASLGDGRRTLSAFPANLGRNLVGVFSRDSLSPVLVGVAAAGPGHPFDRRVEGWLDGKCVRCGSVGATMGGAAIVPVVGAFFVAGRFAPEGRFRAMSYDAAQALIVNAAWTGGLKYSFRRQRPDGSDSLSLPSGHASSAFALATVVDRHYGWKAGVPSYLVAAGIGLSRVESNRHYLSDVIAGAALGLTVGRTVTRQNGGTPPGHRTFAVGPSTDSRGRGIGLGLSASW